MIMRVQLRSTSFRNPHNREKKKVTKLSLYKQKHGLIIGGELKRVYRAAYVNSAKKYLQWRVIISIILHLRALTDWTTRFSLV